MRTGFDARITLGLRRRRSGGEPPAGSTWEVLATVLGLLAGLVADRPLQAELVAGSAWRSPAGMDFVWIPAGTFLMGSPEGEAGRDDDELQRAVTISQGFWLGKYEVTQGEWEAVTGENPSEFRACGARCPVEWVSWDDVQEFIRKLNAKESGSGYEYRLPTEAEWEYAARAGTTGATPEGELRILGEHNASELDGQAWYGGNSGVDYAGAWDCSRWPERQHAAAQCGTHPVGRKRANAWGLHDMLGNVREWTGDWYGEYPSVSVTDPAGPRTGSARVNRGGGWRHAARHVRSAYRNGNAPGYRFNLIGFRLVRALVAGVVAEPPQQAELGAGSAWRSPAGMEFVWIPAGMFVIGSPEGEADRFDDERQREVRIGQGFYMGKYEVTQGEWEAVMGANPSELRAWGSRCPVEGVTWNEVQSWIRTLNAMESGSGYEYRLPTEAEWEYAARAGTVGTRYGELDEIAWYEGNSGGRPHPVGEKRANGWGLHDMLGNVWEWTWDRMPGYDHHVLFSDRRVIRGGGWGASARSVRTAARDGGYRGDRSAHVGFRLVRTE